MAPKDQSKEDQTSWQVDRRIPLTLVFMVVVQTGAFVWSAAKLSSDVNNLRETTVRLESQINKLTEKFETKQETFATKEELNRLYIQHQSDYDKIEARLQSVEKTSHSHKK